MRKIKLAQIGVLPAICCIVTVYFIYHGVQGNRGYRRMYQLQEEIALARAVADQTRRQKESLQVKVRALSPESLDLDQLEESALRVLNMGRAEDRVILTR